MKGRFKIIFMQTDCENLITYMEHLFCLIVLVTMVTVIMPTVPTATLHQSYTLQYCMK